MIAKGQYTTVRQSILRGYNTGGLLVRNVNVDVSAAMRARAYVRACVRAYVDVCCDIFYLCVRTCIH